jgi:hypothetical protein
MAFVNVEIKKLPYTDTAHRFHMRTHISDQDPQNPETGELYIMADLPISRDAVRCELCSDPGTDDVELLAQLFQRGCEYLDQVQRKRRGFDRPPCSFDRELYTARMPDFEQLDYWGLDEVSEFHKDPKALGLELAYTRYALAKAEANLRGEWNEEHAAAWLQELNKREPY